MNVTKMVTISMQKCFNSYQEGLYSKKCTCMEQNFACLTYLKAIFHVNHVNSQFCSYTMLNTFASQKSVFRDFPDNAWE